MGGDIKRQLGNWVGTKSYGKHRDAIEPAKELLQYLSNFIEYQLPLSLFEEAWNDVFGTQPYRFI